MRRFGLLFAALLALAACSHSSDPDGGARDGGPDLPTCTDDIPPACDPGTSGETLVYVVSSMSFPMTSGTPRTLAPGFDLDGTTATVCGQRDYTRPGGDAAACGVDDAFGPVFQSLFVGTIDDGIRDGSALQLLVVRGVDDVVDDPCVGVTYLVGAVSSDAPSVVLAPDGGLASGQHFDVDGTSFDAHAAARFTFGAARIVSGTLEAASGELTWAAVSPGGLPPAHPPLHRARLEVRLTRDALASGVLGGSITVDELATIAATDPGWCPYAGYARTLFAPLADLDVLPDGGCASGSTSIAFTGVGASLHACGTAFDCGPGRACTDGVCRVTPTDAGTCP